ncbi:MAG: hypothetical protein IKQ47_06630 [Prevotella sp.]|nr:hypothetical protein [Prevotella sp.]
MKKKLIAVKNWLVLLLGILLVVRVYMMLLSYKEGMPGLWYYMFRQTVYTVSWLSLLVFFMNHGQKSNALLEIYLKKMKKIAFWTMVISAVRVLVSLKYNWPLLSYKVWPSVYNVLELAVWLLITAFFYLYWRKMSKAKEV